MKINIECQHLYFDFGISPGLGAVACCDFNKGVKICDCEECKNFQKKLQNDITNKNT